MKKDNIYIILMLQAVLTLLLFFSENTWRYVTIGLFCLLELFILASLIRRTWSYSEPFTFATLITSILFLIFYLYNPTAITVILGIGVMFLFLISAMLAYKSKKSTYPKELPTPVKPVMQTYELEEFDKEPNHLEQERNDYTLAESAYQKKQLEERRKTLDQKQKEKSKYEARAIAYELEREAAELKRADNYVQKKDVELIENELVNEADSLEEAEEQIRNATLRQKKVSTDAQIQALQNAEKEIVQMKRQETEQELRRQAKKLEDAEKKLRDAEFIAKQKEITRQALELAKAQAQINKIEKSKLTSSKSKSAKTIKTIKNEAVFATKTGNNFHETGCMVIKNIPKKNLILFNKHKDALKKGYKPCNVCKP